ncbi:hypothetical protein ASPZODRAFT_132623 [Penicilliopsis zonata CBS 506.65]|uniref:DUF833 domain-containing protein n=1 Tax=Penicilliopsis zonata CBS 506.65 TaxID=1073090 RepID=A0A1L9SHF0_9EURO|nr:hypothetical protein ASPZODRAFT_132623 [Penicilliopsis zonata CBS 506.65]OJJ46557.1 hypothetical protein ASPZODRAFT_132623 [Penicilliopsis zonata CBS 506.65]
MCIALVSTSHPSYSLIVIDNRDEFLRRPTSSLEWWPEPNGHVLASRDLARAVHGTWMGVTRQGKVAVLTNYREDTADAVSGMRSRGVIVNSWLATPADGSGTTREFAEEMIASQTFSGVGGFSLVFGRVNEPLAVVSNRSSQIENVDWIATEKKQTVGLSNTAFDDRSWPKILDGERLMEEAIASHVAAGENEEDLIQRLLAVLCTDTLPRMPEGSGLETYLPHLRKSIFIPVIGHTDRQPVPALDKEGAEERLKAASQPDAALDPAYIQGAYGTQKQTVVLVTDQGRVRYFERTLYDQQVNPVPQGEGDTSVEFTVEPPPSNPDEGSS